MTLGNVVKKLIAVKVFLILIPVFAGNSIASDNNEGAVHSPVVMDKNKISGIGLESVIWHDDNVNAKWSFLFEGEELSVSVFESRNKDSKSGKNTTKSFVKNYPYDEFVLVLSGQAILTDSSGKSRSFVAGDSFVVPKGFTGTWESAGVFRELIVILNDAVKTREIDATTIDTD